MKKVIYSMLGLFAGSVLITTLSSSGGSGNPQHAWEQEPPIVKNFFVQKLSAPTSSENMIFRTEFYPDSSLPNTISIYENGSLTRTIKDDGVFPDITANDFIYATYVYENLTGFISKIQSSESKMSGDGGVFHFTAHDGEYNAFNDKNLFNVSDFNAFKEIQIYQPVLDVTFCDDDLLKQNSLFITDLSVVEDPARTYNVYANTGNSVGAWTFGNLIKNMANVSVTGVSAKNFLKNWLQNWTTDQSVGSFASPGNFNYNNVLNRSSGVRMHMIDPWITKAWTAGTPPSSTDITTNTWEYYWDQISESSLLQNAPFKLMAIVNRLDLRGNNVYGGPVDNAGETRFIYTLIDPTTGMPPVHNDASNPSFGAGAAGAIDWVGMNVILEYGNPIDNLCDLKTFAQQWYDLSNYPLGTGGVPNDDFNDNLEIITNSIIEKNAGGNKNLNKSALNQIRTDEKIFQLRSVGTDPINWETLDWQFRQFELDGDDNSGYLLEKPVTNTPVDERPYEFGGGTAYYSYNNAINIPLGNTSNALWGPSGSADLLSWIYGPAGTSFNRIRVSMGNHNLPEPFLAGTARMYKEMVHYFGFDWSYLPANVYDEGTFDPAADAPDELAKKIRHQISLNTCQGCHSGDTKTNFTQMYPRGYGEEAKYWDATPDYVSNAPFGLGNTVDERFNIVGGVPFIDNTGTTFDSYLSGDVANLDFAEKTTNSTNQILSPFLTGRKYSDQIGNNWEDDMLDNAGAMEGSVGNVDVPNNLADDLMHGLFYVNDPANESASIPSGWAPLGGNFPQKHDRRWGFNDLQRRKNLLCIFVNQNCSGNTLFVLMQNMAFLPLPIHAH